MEKRPDFGVQPSSWSQEENKSQEEPWVQEEQNNAKLRNEEKAKINVLRSALIKAWDDRVNAFTALIDNENVNSTTLTATVLNLAVGFEYGSVGEPKDTSIKGWVCFIGEQQGQFYGIKSDIGVVYGFFNTNTKKGSYFGEFASDTGGYIIKYPYIIRDHEDYFWVITGDKSIGCEQLYSGWVYNAKIEKGLYCCSTGRMNDETVFGSQGKFLAILNEQTSIERQIEQEKLERRRLFVEKENRRKQKEEEENDKRRIREEKQLAFQLYAGLTYTRLKELFDKRKAAYKADPQKLQLVKFPVKILGERCTLQDTVVTDPRSGIVNGRQYYFFKVGTKEYYCQTRCEKQETGFANKALSFIGFGSPDSRCEWDHPMIIHDPDSKRFDLLIIGGKESGVQVFDGKTNVGTLFASNNVEDKDLFVDHGFVDKILSIQTLEEYNSIIAEEQKKKMMRS